MRIKRVICTLLTVLLVVTGWPSLIQEVQADSYTWTDETNGIVFTYEDKTDGSVIITKIEPVNTSTEAGNLDLVFPDIINDKNVTEIAFDSVKQGSLYKTVTFNKYITGVPYHWAQGLTNVTSITFPTDSECVALAEEAFAGCGKLTTVVFGNGLKTIGKKLFYQSGNLSSVTFGNSLESIGDEAFQGTKVTNIVIPDSVTNIGEKAFYSCTSLATLTLGSGLTSIGEGAFRRIAISELVLPNSLTTLGVDAFRDIGNLTSITWPQGNAMFNTVDGFNGCSALSNDVLSSIPSTVTTIADYAFANCHFTTVTIPQSVEYVGEYAFSTNSYLESIVIKESNAPLTIDEYAFKETSKLVSKDIILPERVSVLKDNAFGFGYNTNNTFTIYNKNIVIEGDPWDKTRWTTIKYPSDLTSETSPTFITYKTNREANPGDYPFAFETFNIIQTYTVSGTIPNGAILTANVNGTITSPTLTSGSFSFEANSGSYVSLTISLDKYQDYVLTKKSSEFTSDLTIAVSIADMVPVSTSGILEILTEGDGAMDANVSIFASDGSIAASGVATGGLFVSPSLKQGSYTVVAIAKNSYISSITSLTSFDELGLKASDYARVNAMITAGGTAKTTLNVPNVSVADYSTWVDSVGSFVDIDRSIVTLGMEFYADVYYRMADDKNADEVRIVIPSGFDVVSVTSESTKYNVSAIYNAGVITLSELSGKDKSSGTVYVGLRSQKTGSFAISASVTSSDVTIPIGSKDFAVDSIMMKLSSELLTSREFGVTIYAQPGKTIKLKPGIGDEIVLGTANKLGYLKATAELPTDSIPGISYGVIATVTDDEGTHSDVSYVYLVEESTSIKDFYFIHGNRQYYLAQNGVNKSGGFYNYISDGSEASKNWTFGVTFESITAISGNVTVSIKMEDGSFRDLVLSKVSSTVQNGKVLTVYAGNIYLGTGEYHVFDSSMIPAGFNVNYESEFVPMETTEEYDENLYKIAEEEYDDRLMFAMNKLHPGYSDNIGVWTKEQAINYIVTSGDYNSIFGKKYYVSTSKDPDVVALYSLLTDEQKQDVIAMEKAIDDALVALAEYFGDSKPLYEYSSWDEYMLDNWMDVTEHTLKSNTLLMKKGSGGGEVDVEQLISAGYTISGNVAFKVDKNNGAYSYFFLDTKNNSATEYTQKNKDVNLEFWDNVSDTTSTASSLTDIGLSTLDAAAQASGSAKAIEAVGAVTSKVGTPLGFINTIASYVDLYNRSETYKNNMDEARKIETDMMNADMKLDQIHKQWLEGKISAECYFAMQDEAQAYSFANDDAKLRNDIVWQGMCYGAVSATVGAILFVPAGAEAIGAAATVESFAFLSGTEAACTSTLVGALSFGVDQCVKKITADANIDVAYNLARAKSAHMRRVDACERNDFSVDYWKEAIKDPSGFVYEAVESNRIEGATATLVNVTSGLNFNATDYDQENPLTTDVEGRYAWDVPNGIWRVDVSKAGYTTSSSANLEVPPPRMDVRIPLVTNQAPQVESVNAYKDYVEIIFDQYMKVDAASGIVASIDDIAASSYSWIDPEESPSSEYYSKVVRINTPSGTEVGDNLQIVVNNAKNYAGSSMSSAYNSNVEVTHRPSTIELNYETSLTIKNGETKKVIVKVKDEDGNYMKGLTVNAIMENTFFATIDSSGVTDSNGTVNLNAEGILPGLTNVKFTVSGTTFEKTIEVKVETEPVRTKRPTAIVGGTTIGEGAPKVNNVIVEKGSTLTLSTATAGAKIYYMTGESAPCSNCVLEKEYTGPIVLNENVKITAIAYKAGLEYSEDLVINITVTQKADCTIAYNLNGGSIYGLTGSIYESYNKGTTINLLDAPSRAGYKFLYWDNSEYKAGSSYVVNGNRTFNAIWKIIDNNTGGKDTGKDDTGKGSDTDPKTSGKDDTTPKNPTDNPVPGEDTTNNQGISAPLLITLIVCGIGVLTFIFILIGKRRKKEDE